MIDWLALEGSALFAIAWWLILLWIARKILRRMS